MFLKQQRQLIATVKALVEPLMVVAIGIKQHSNSDQG